MNMFYRLSTSPSHSHGIKTFNACGLLFPSSAANPVIEYVSANWLKHVKNKRGVIAALKQRRAAHASYAAHRAEQSRKIAAGETYLYRGQIFSDD